MNPRHRIMRRFIILLCLVLCLIAFWLMRTAWEPKEAKKPSSTSQVVTTPSASKLKNCGEDDAL